jgi:hypothetical protein
MNYSTATSTPYPRPIELLNMAAVFAPLEATLQETSARLLETAPEMLDLEPKTSPLPAATLENLECDERGGLDDSVAPVAPAELG